MTRNSRPLQASGELPQKALRAPLVVVLLGVAVVAAGCAAGPAGKTPAHTGPPRALVDQKFIGPKTVRVQARVRGEGDDVVVAGEVRGLGLTDDGGHVDIAVYAASGWLLAAVSAPYVPAGLDEASFEQRLPGLRGRTIRLRLAHHAAALPTGSGSCPSNAALEED